MQNVLRALAGSILLSLAVAGPAAADPVIRTRGGDVSALGPFKVTKDPRLGAAIRAYGEPTRARAVGGGDGCIVKWRRRGLRITFANFGLGHACSPGHGLAQVAVIRGSGARHWRTAPGLRIGMHENRVRKLHPDAERHRSSWWLATTTLPYGATCPCRYPSLKANVGRSRVSSFRAWLGHAGD